MTRSTRWIVAGALLLSAAASPAGARADAAPASIGLTDVFVRFCGETNGDADRALQRADADGWSLPPKWITVPSFGPPVEWTRREGRWTQSHSVRRVLMVGTIRDPSGRDTLMCTLAEVVPPGMKADLPAMRGALQDWVGGAPVRADAAFTEFVYRESQGRRVPLPPSEDPLANGAPRAPPDVASVGISDMLGKMVSITYQRSR